MLKSNQTKENNYLFQHFVSCWVLLHYVDHQLSLALMWNVLVSNWKTVFLNECSVPPYSRIVFVLCLTLPVVLWHTPNGESVSDIHPTITRFAIGTSPFFWSDQVRTLLGCVCWWFLEIVCRRYIHRLYVQITLNCWDVPKDLLFQEVKAMVSDGVPSRT